MVDEFEKYKRELEQRRREIMKMKPGPAVPSRKVPQPPRYDRLPPVRPEHTRLFAHKKFLLIVLTIIVLIIVFLLVINFTQKDITEEELAKIREAKFLESLAEEMEEEEIFVEVPEEEKEMQALEQELEEGFKEMGAAFNIRNFGFEIVGDHIELTHDLNTLTVDYADERYKVTYFENIDLRDPTGQKILWFNDKYSTATTLEVDGGLYQTVTRTFREPLSLFDLRGTYRLKLRATDATPFVKDEKTFEFVIE